MVGGHKTAMSTTTTVSSLYFCIQQWYQFTSAEFTTFVEKQYSMSALSFIPPSNQQVRRKESTVVLTHMGNTKLLPPELLVSFEHIIACHTRLGVTPAELLLG